MNKKAINLLNDGVYAMQQNQKDIAIKKLQEAIKIEPQFCDAIMLLGDIYNSLDRSELAIPQYEKAIAIDSAYAGRMYKKIAEIEQRSGKYDQAVEHYTRFLTVPKLGASEKQQVQKQIENSKFASYAIAHPVPFNPVSLGDSINTPYAEYLPALTIDEQKIIFTRRDVRQPDSEDFYISKKNKAGQWRRAYNAGPPLNTPNNEGAECISPDGNFIFFTRCNDKRDGFGGCDIYISKKQGNGWLPGNNLGPVINTAQFESMPSFSSDGKTLYFVANRKADTYGGTDIYSTEIGNDGNWTTPKNLGPTINTAYDEKSVFIHPDNQTLYFSSSGHPGMGKDDLFYCRRKPDGSWGTAVNLGYPINTSEQEGTLIVSADGKTAYFASTRGKEDKSDMDLFSFELYPSARPIEVTYMKGIITDAKTSKPVMASFQLINLDNGEVVTESSSDKTTGEYLVSIPAGKNYALNVSNPSYLFHSENFSLKGHQTNEPYNKNVALNPIEVGQSVVMNNVFFETNKFDLKPESKVELNKLVDFMRSNPTLKVEIGGHTDNTGLKATNEALSKNRAKSVYDYLVSNKIAATRLSYKGYADTKPIADNTTDDGRARNRRTEFMITEK